MRELPLFYPILKASDTMSLFLKVRPLGTLKVLPPKVLGGPQADKVLNDIAQDHIKHSFYRLSYWPLIIIFRSKTPCLDFLEMS